MNNELGMNAEKWMDVILSFRSNPSKFDMTDSIFDLYSVDANTTQEYLIVATSKWAQITNTETISIENIDKVIPFWMSFLIPRRHSVLLLSLWMEKFKKQRLAQYQEIIMVFSELIQNYIREELLLFKYVRPFRKQLGRSILTESDDPEHEISDSTYSALEVYSSPQYLMTEIANFADNKTIQAGLAYILLTEKFSVLTSKVQSKDQLLNVIAKFQTDKDKLAQFNFLQPEIPVMVEAESTEQVKRISKPSILTRKITIQFEKVELKEYDGYVQMKGYGPGEQRIFRIMNSEEEDMLREEMWKERRYELRKIISEVLMNKYSTKQKSYNLKRGVEITIEQPNWLS